ncbi:MAG: aconitate hydratase AcnA, partial [Gammaproteobacteria bacterium]|nr:aconitate hydratase AcnA [Gammaproteobacteria bacterium]
HSGAVNVEMDGQRFTLIDGAVVIAAITSCTNTSNPAVMIGAGLLARNARQRGLSVKPWVKTSLAPGSAVVTEYLRKAGLLDDLSALGFQVVGYGCTTCIGNSGPLPEPISSAIHKGDLIACAVLSGNRNFEGRIHADVRMNFLASPPLVVAYAIVGAMNVDLDKVSLGRDGEGNDVYLHDIWPDPAEISETIVRSIGASMFRDSYRGIFDGDAQWRAMDILQSKQYQWDDTSTYIRNPPYFRDMTEAPVAQEPIRKARVLCLLGDSVTTDHISPAGAIMADSPAGRWLMQQGVEPEDFNSYGSRRGNHEVMMRGTFANIRLRNQLVPGIEGGWTRYMPDGDQMPIYDAAMRYQADSIPLLVIAGQEYGSGSSRDWAAKGTLLLEIRAVLAVSFERIHRSNLIGMGVLPLQFRDGDDAGSLGIDGSESFTIESPSEDDEEVGITAQTADGETRRFRAVVRIDTPKEWDYYRNGGILHYVVRQLAG